MPIRIGGDLPKGKKNPTEKYAALAENCRGRPKRRLLPPRVRLRCRRVVPAARPWAEPEQVGKEAVAASRAAAAARGLEQTPARATTF